MLVKDMPVGIRSALYEREFTNDCDISPEKALNEWALWNLGDDYWSRSIISYYKIMTGISKD